MKKLHFSIIIPVYNKEKSIAATVHSVLNQTYPFFELILINDGSTDNSMDIIYSIKDSRIVVVNQLNQGVSAARNYGITKAQFPWIAFLDGDDLWDQNYLNSAQHLFNSKDGIKVLATNYNIVNQHTKTVALKLDTGFVQSYLKSPCMTSSSVIINKEVFDTVGQFPVGMKYGEDHHLWYRIADVYPVFFNAEALADYNIADHFSRNKSYANKDITKDLVWHISDLNLSNPDWQQFKNKYLLKYLRPYYICDKHLSNVLNILAKVPITKELRQLRMFYKLPRWVIKPVYKWFFELRYKG